MTKKASPPIGQSIGQSIGQPTGQSMSPIPSSIVPDMPRIAVEYWPMSRFKPYLGNPRKHERAEIEQLAEAIRTFGFRVPVLVKAVSGEVVDGHFRIKAADKVGLKELPVIPCDDMTDAQIRAFRLSVNRMSELARWDNNHLLAELEKVEAEGEVELGKDGAVGFELEDADEDAVVGAWDITPTQDLHVITIKGPLPVEAEVRHRLRGMEGVTIEASVLRIPPVALRK